MSFDVRPEPLGDGRTAYSGALPAGAARAILLDRRGVEHEATIAGGRWRVVLDERMMGFALPPVRFHDAAGAIVRAPVPQGEPVRDALTGCPACGAMRWSATAEIVACDVCGHGHELPGPPIELREVAPVIELDVEPLPEPGPPWAIDERHVLDPAHFATARIAFYGPPARDLRLGGHGGTPERLDSLTVRHEEIEVRTDETGFAAPPAEQARQALLPALPQPGSPIGRSAAAITLWSAQRERSIEATAAAATIGERVVELDGAPVTFTTATANGVVGAVAVVGGAAVTITAPAGAFPSALRRLAAADVA
jgi:hypothetical protein